MAPACPLHHTPFGISWIYMGYHGFLWVAMPQRAGFSPYTQISGRLWINTLFAHLQAVVSALPLYLRQHEKGNIIYPQRYPQNYSGRMFTAYAVFDNMKTHEFLKFRLDKN